MVELPEDHWYVSEEAALAAVRRGSQFNVLDMETGWKAHLIVRKARPFSRAEFDRRERAELLGVATWIATAEDTMFAKLEWRAKGGGLERQLADVVGILPAVGEGLDGSPLPKLPMLPMLPMSAVPTEAWGAAPGGQRDAAGRV